MEEPDPAAIRAAAAGDVDAFTVLVRQFQTPVWRFVSRLLDDPELAEDVTQETFLRAYRRLATFEFRSKFSTWLFQVARNTAVDTQRSRARQRRIEQVVLPRDAAPASDATTYLAAAIRALDAPLREALVTVEVLGFTYREAATVLAVPEGTVKRRVHVARLRVTSWMNQGTESEGAGDEL